MSNEKVALIILDGYGIGEPNAGNAIYTAKTPVMDGLLQRWPHTKLSASGLDVGLPDGQMGNSEVGHTNIGSGRVVFQDLPRITKAIVDGAFFANPVYAAALDNAANGKALHILGLLSDGGVHSHIRHIFAMVKMAHDRGIQRVYLHCFLDGRDVAPVEEAVQVHPLDSTVVRHFHHGENVPDMAVHAAVGQQTENVQGLAVRRIVKGGSIDRVSKECTVHDGLCDAREVLKHDAAGADVRVADLAVAHLAVRQADVQTGGRELRVRPALQETVHHRRFGRVDGVSRIRLADAVAVEDDECDFLVAHSQAPCAVAAMIFEKSTGLSDAPPIRPPSISGWASSSAALPAFMEPP